MKLLIGKKVYRDAEKPGGGTFRYLYGTITEIKEGWYYIQGFKFSCQDVLNNFKFTKS